MNMPIAHDLWPLLKGGGGGGLTKDKSCSFQIIFTFYFLVGTCTVLKTTESFTGHLANAHARQLQISATWLAFNYK